MEKKELAQMILHRYEQTELNNAGIAKWEDEIERLERINQKNKEYIASSLQSAGLPEIIITKKGKTYRFESDGLVTVVENATVVEL